MLGVDGSGLRCTLDLAWQKRKKTCAGSNPVVRENSGATSKQQGHDVADTPARVKGQSSLSPVLRPLSQQFAAMGL